jgi:hypothetical protein
LKAKSKQKALFSPVFATKSKKQEKNKKKTRKNCTSPITGGGNIYIKDFKFLEPPSGR